MRFLITFVITLGVTLFGILLLATEANCETQDIIDQCRINSYKISNTPEEFRFNTNICITKHHQQNKRK